MTFSPRIGTLLAALAFASGAACLQAQTMTPSVSSPVAPGDSGLVGTSYGSVGYGLIDFHGQDIDAHALKLELNQNIGANLDTFANYEYDRSDEFSGGRVTQHLAALGARGFAREWGRFKPYGEAGVGWTWFRAPFGIKEDSFLWLAGAGVEINLGQRWTLTPFVRYYDLHEFDDSKIWNYGVRASFWLNERIGFQVSGTRDDDKNMEYAVGLNFRL